MFTDWEPLFHAPLAMSLYCLIVMFDVLAQDWVKQWRDVFNVFLLNIVNESDDFGSEISFVHAFVDLVYVVVFSNSI